METYKNNARGAGAERQSEAEADTSEPDASVWASAAHRRRGGQIGDGLLHNIEMRVGSIA
ncbi:MAG: hypothetical protein AAGL92_15465 [Pseudomonadota bacterium]